MVTDIKISRFWSRIAAFAIDGIILGISGFILGLIFEGFLTRIGTYGYLFGLMICLVYFTIFNSKLCKGQTVGKLALMIQVVDKDGNTLSVGRSLYRALILCGPYFLVNVDIPGIYTGSFLYIMKDIILISLYLGVVVIYIFNRGNRQSLHDIFAGTFVVAKKRMEEIVPEIHQEFNSEMQEENSSFEQKEITPQELPEIVPEIRTRNTSFPSITKYSWYIFGGIVILLIAFDLYFFTDKNNVFGNINSVYNKISNIDGVAQAGITKNTTKSFSRDNSITRTYIATIWVTEIPDDIDDLENNEIVIESVRTIVDNEPEIDNFDIISISLVKGFNIGIAKKSTSYNVQKAPADWKKLLTNKTIYN
jgi:uncharacterized RDD family membrane protein YckC